MSVDRSTRKAFGISFFLHILFISFFIASALCPPPPQPTPRRLVVQSIALKPSSQRTVSVRSGPSPKAAAKAEQPPAPSSPPPALAEKHEESAPAEIAMALSEEPGSPEESPAPPQESPAKQPEPSEKTSEEPPSPPKPTSKSSPQPSKAQSSIKAEPASKSSPKKSAQPAKSQPAGKASVKASSTAKGKTTTTQKPKATNTNSSSAQGSAKKSSPSQGPAYDQKLLNEALQRLDKSKSAAKGSGAGSGSGGTSGGGGGGNGHGISHVGTVGALNVEQGFAGCEGTEDSPFQGYSSASPEAYYIGDLIRRLQLNVRLPEPGEIRVRLSLKRNGAVANVNVLSGKTASIKRSIEEKLRSVHFSPFGASFSGEAEHTFLLRLSNELVWSCS